MIKEKINTLVTALLLVLSLFIIFASMPFFQLEGRFPQVDSQIILLHFTLGVLLAKKSFSVKILVMNMPIYGIIAAIIVLYYDLEIPGYIENTTFLLTYSTIFLVLMSLGVALTKLKIISWVKSITLSSVRVILGPFIGLIFIKLLNLKGYAAGVLFIQASMPSAILTYLVGSMYSEKKVVDSIASIIFISTVMSFISIPIVVFIALKYFA